MKSTALCLALLFSTPAFAQQGNASLKFWGTTPSKLELLGIERLAQLDALAKCEHCSIAETTPAKCETIQDDMDEGLACSASATAQ